nr:unnamed protein product [Callosobruchus analis]
MHIRSTELSKGSERTGCFPREQSLRKGDFNTDLLNFASLDAKYVIDIFESFGMKQLIKQPTRIAANAATPIDYILTSNEDIVSDAGTIHVAGISDHELVYCLIDFRLKSNITFVTTRNFKVLNYDQFKSDLRSIPWKNVYDLSDMDKIEGSKQIAGNRSSFIRLHSGVPQGYILGALLFSIYTCQLESALVSCQQHHYADHTQVYTSFFPDEAPQVICALNLDLNLSYNSSLQHCLKLNPLKCSLIVFGNRHIKTNSLTVKH